MTTDIQPTSEDSQIVLYKPNDSISLEVKIDAAHETVWLTQQQIADLFGTKQPAISKHLSNIYKSGELDEDSTYSILEYMGNDGKQKYKIKYYNLDAIISVGYRVNSVNATAFRRWATNVLHDYLLKGYSINRQLVALQERVDNRFSALEQRLDKHDEQIAFFIRTNQPPIEGIFYEGQVLDARDFAETLIKSAQREVLLVDNYIDARTFEILEVRNPGVQCAIYVERIGNGLRTLQQTSLTQTSRTIDLRTTSQRMHDRFLIVDDTVYHLGASLNEPREQREQYQASA